MPWRKKFLTSRLHPLAVTAYALTLEFGLLFTFHLMHTQALQGVQVWVDWAWRIMLLLGGALGLFSIFSRPKEAPDWPDLVDLLKLEGMSAGLSGLGWAVYAFSISEVSGLMTVPVWALGSLGLGLVARSFLATREASEAKRLGEVYDAANDDPELRELLQRIRDEE
jgi:hypothetical protein